MSLRAQSASDRRAPDSPRPSGPALVFRVPGRAQPGGSKRAFPYRKRDGKLGVRVSDDNPRARSWKGDVIFAATEAIRVSGWARKDGPLSLVARFLRARPADHQKSNGTLSAKGIRTPYPTTKPDATKLLRVLEEAMTEAGVWTDDARVVMQTASKEWGERDEVHVAVIPIETDGPA